MKKTFLSVMAAAAIAAVGLAACSSQSSTSTDTSSAAPSDTSGAMASDTSAGMASPAAMATGMYAGMKTGPDHGMPEGNDGGDGPSFTGAPDLQAAISLVTAGGAPGNFSLAKALTALAGPTVTSAEVAKLTKQYGKARVASFITVQNFAVNDAVKIATAAKVKFPSPTLKGATLAKRVVTLGLVDGTYYEGVQLDHLVTNKIHEAVMDDIDKKYGTMADANYHAIADQAHYDLAHALGVTSVKLAAFH
ncbi:MAG: hypothetical protein M3R51_00860 [Candidatus Eremiobacteraeota bacterium]|nr:hypothetical protein [Candidatus Eremiobacteraeota bacterium]